MFFCRKCLISFFPLKNHLKKFPRSIMILKCRTILNLTNVKFHTKLLLMPLPMVVCCRNKEILRNSNAIVSLDLRIAISKGFFGKIFSRCGLFLNNKITAEAGVIDSGYHGIVHGLFLITLTRCFL